MPRHRRPVLEDVPLHIIQRGNDRRPCFFAEADYLVYLDMMRESLALACCQLHAYVLMTNHVHLLVTPARANSAAQLMKRLGERYVQYVNRRYERAGTLWEGRYKSCLVQDDDYLMVCYRYIELNPVRANMVATPADYRWSSYLCNAHGAKSELIAPHLLYEGLGESTGARELAYRSLFDATLSDGQLEHVRSTVNQNSIFGSEQFVDSMEKAWGNAIMPRRPGRTRD